jgi:AraC-like DNA-binding protein
LSEFVNKVRLQAACRELAETDAAVTEIAMNCGFGEISFFNRLFRREKGCSPREWRNQRRS